MYEGSSKHSGRWVLLKKLHMYKILDFMFLLTFFNVSLVSTCKSGKDTNAQFTTTCHLTAHKEAPDYLFAFHIDPYHCLCCNSHKFSYFQFCNKKQLIQVTQILSQPLADHMYHVYALNLA